MNPLCISVLKSIDCNVDIQDIVVHTTIDNKCKYSMGTLTPDRTWPNGQINPDSKVHVTYTGPTWGRQEPGGPHVVPMNFAIKEHQLWASRIYQFSNNTNLRLSPEGLQAQRKSSGGCSSKVIVDSIRIVECYRSALSAIILVTVQQLWGRCEYYYVRGQIGIIVVWLVS